MEAKQEAGPWQIGGHGEIVASVDRLFGAPIEIRAPNSHTSSDSTDKQNARSEATAAFIVRACNAHDPLVEELRNIADAKWDDMTAQDFMDWAKSRARHALRKLEAE